MMMRKALSVFFILVLVAGISACRKDRERRQAERAADMATTTMPTGITQEIQLPPGLIHLQAQWVGGSLWIESYDPNTRACLFREYRDGKPLDGGGKVLMKGCRVSFAPEIQAELADEHTAASPKPAKAGKAKGK